MKQVRLRATMRHRNLWRKPCVPIRIAIGFGV